MQTAVHRHSQCLPALKHSVSFSLIYRSYTHQDINLIALFFFKILFLDESYGEQLVQNSDGDRQKHRMENGKIHFYEH